MHRRLIRLNRWLAALSGWRRRLAAFVLGAAAALALPPVYAVPVLIPAFVGLVWLMDASPTRRAAFTIGWWFGFGHFVAGLYWIGIAIGYKLADFWWFIPFTVLGLPAILAVYTGAAAALTQAAVRARLVSGVGRILVFAALWVAFEWVRGWALSGFPWNLIGTVWSFSDAMIQVAAVTGVYGLSLATVLAAAMPAALTDADLAPSNESLSPVFASWAWRATLAAFAVLAGVWVSGAARLAGAATETVPGAQLRLVQPNIPQELKWQKGKRAGHVMKQLHMSRRAPPPGDPPPRHVIWAETAVPFNLANDPRLQRIIGDAAPQGGLIIAGAPRTTPPGTESYRVWNSLHGVSPDGRIVATYDKAHLVPFGEYVPFRSVLRMPKITAGMTDFTPGPGPRTLRLAGLPPVSPLICYEGIFPGRVVGPGERPRWLLNVTNDAWYGRSSGPYQHFAAVRFRAVEEGMPLVRVANTGISGIVDAYGRVVARLGLGTAGTIDRPLPQSLESLTVYARFGDVVIWGLIAACFVAGAGLARRG